MIDLNVLIPTVPKRVQKLSRLMDSLSSQRRSNVRFNILCDESNKSIGLKRHEMLAGATGRYVCFIDDDDIVAPDYIDSILEKFETEPDVVGFKLSYHNNGIHSGIIDQSLKYKTFNKSIFRRGDGSDFFTVTKAPNHLNPVKTSLAQKIGFPDLRYGEDKVYSLLLNPYLKTEAYIDKFLYHYMFEREDNSYQSFKSTYISPGAIDKC